MTLEEQFRAFVGAIEECGEVEGELVDYVLCLRDNPANRARAYYGDCRGYCSKCGADVFWSSTSPVLPPRICLECAVELGRAALSGSDRPA